MIQLSFQPALDPFHTMFRLLRLRTILRNKTNVTVDHVRILDFYLAFPFLAKNIRLRREHARLKIAVNKIEWPVPYGDQPEDKIVFARMAPIQEIALQTLASHSFLNGTQLDKGVVEVAEAPIPKDLASRVENANMRELPLLALLSVLTTDYILSGSGGLKDRSGLLEYRYDAV